MGNGAKKKDHTALWLLLGEVLCLAVTVLLILFLVQKLLPGLMTALRSDNEQVIEAYLRSAGTLDCILCLLVMCVLQVVSIMIPGMPIHIAAAMVLGIRKGFAVSYFGFLLANALVFQVGRLLRKPVRRVAESYPSLGKQFDRLRTGKNPELITLIANLLPCVPNGIIPYAAAQTGLDTMRFLIAVAAGSALPIFADCLVGGLILSGDFLVAILVFAVLIALAAVLYWKKDAVNRWMERR